MIHFFDTNIAEKCGVNAAIIMTNLKYWIDKNRANNVNFFDGHYWTYNSAEAFAKLFPYMTPNNIRGALTKLLEAEYIIKGNYNKAAYDRTLWYAITPAGYMAMSDKTGHEDQNADAENQKSISKNSQMDFRKNQNGFSQKSKPIPDIKQDKKTVNNKQNVYYCAEPETASTPPVITIILNDKSEYPFYQTDIDQWQELFPGVNVVQAMRNIKAWCINNPTKRKTRAGIRRFVNAWLARDQDRPAQIQTVARNGGRAPKNMFAVDYSNQHEYDPEEYDKKVLLDLSQFDEIGG